MHLKGDIKPYIIQLSWLTAVLFVQGCAVGNYFNIGVVFRYCVFLKIVIPDWPFPWMSLWWYLFPAEIKSVAVWGDWFTNKRNPVFPGGSNTSRCLGNEPALLPRTDSFLLFSGRTERAVESEPSSLVLPFLLWLPLPPPPPPFSYC